MKLLVAVVAGVLPVLAALAFNVVTYKEDDANIGGGILFVVAVPLGIVAGRHVHRTLRRS